MTIAERDLFDHLIFRPFYSSYREDVIYHAFRNLGGDNIGECAQCVLHYVLDIKTPDEKCSGDRITLKVCGSIYATIHIDRSCIVTF